MFDSNGIYSESYLHNAFIYFFWFDSGEQRFCCLVCAISLQFCLGF